MFMPAVHVHVAPLATRASYDVLLCEYLCRTAAVLVQAGNHTPHGVGGLCLLFDSFFVG